MGDWKWHQSNNSNSESKASADSGATWGAAADDMDIIIKGSATDGASDYEIIGHVHWSEQTTGTITNYSYISKFYQEADQLTLIGTDVPKAFFYDSSEGLYDYQDITDTLNSIEDAGIVWQCASGDYFLFSYARRFMGLGLYAGTAPTSLTPYYWNGSAWTEFDKHTFDFDSSNGMIWWEMPTDWVKDSIDDIETESIDGTDRFWIKLIPDTSATIKKIRHSWVVIWDSEDSNSGSYSHYIPIELKQNGDYVMCTLITTDEKDAQTNSGNYLIGELDHTATTPSFSFVDSIDVLTIDNSLQYKGIVSNSNVWYFCAVDKNGDKPILLLSIAEDLAGNGTAASFVKEFKSGETDLKAGLVSNGSIIYGVTAPQYNSLFQYSQTFYPRIQQAQFYNTLKDALEKTLQIRNQIFVVRNTRKIDVRNRDTQFDTIAFYDTDDAQDSNKFYEDIDNMTQPAEYEHFYDGVEISWADIYGNSGVESVGSTGVGKKILKIDNNLIQDKNMAKQLALVFLDYFGKVRMVYQADLIFYFPLEVNDKITNNVISHPFFYLDTTKSWIIINARLDIEHKKLTCIFLEL